MDDLRYGYTSPRSPGALTTILVRDATGTVVRTYEDEAFNDSAPGQYVLAAVEAPLYGSARLGSERTRIRVRFTGAGGSLNPPPGRRRGGTVYELSNRLGNVLATVSDIAAVEPVANAEAGTGEAAARAARVTTASDYYPFGLSVAGRTYEPVLGGSAYADVVAEYRYGFNGKEHDLSWGGLGIQDYGWRLYVPGTGRFLSVDPLAAGYPWYTPYQFAGNKPIIAIDLDGGEEKITVHYQEACCTGAEGLFRTVKTETQIASQMSFTGEHRKAAVHAWFTSGTTSEQNRRLSSHMHVYVVAGDKPGEYKIREAIYKDYPMLEKYRDGGYDKSLAILKGIWDSDLSRAVTPDFLRFTLSSDAAAVVGAKEVDEAVFVLHGKEASTSPRYLKTTLATVGPQAQVTIAAVGVATTNYSGSAEDISIDLLLTGKGAAPTYGVQFSAEEGGGVEASGDLSVIQDSNGNLQTVITTGASVGVGAGAGAAITVGETKLNEPR